MSTAGTVSPLRRFSVLVAESLAGAHPRDQPPEIGPVLRAEKKAEGLARKVGVGDAHQAGGFAVGLLDDAAEVGDEITERRLVEQVTVAVALELELLAGAQQLVVLLLQLLVGHFELGQGGLKLHQLGGELLSRGTLVSFTLQLFQAMLRQGRARISWTSSAST